MFKLASHIVAHGPLHPGDAVGWVVRLCLALDVIHCVNASHGRISAKAVQMLGPSCHAAGFFLDGLDCPEDHLYHSPERLVGDGESPEDDTWALGVLLYYTLTGSLPFAGEGAPELRARILWSKPRPLASVGLDHPCLQRVVDHVLAPDPAGRIQTVGVLRSRLVGCHPAAAKLAALKLGKPDLRALSDDTDDSQGIKLTGILQRGELEQKIREVIERRKAARAAAQAPPPVDADPWSDADTTQRRSTVPTVGSVRPKDPEALTVVRPGGAEPLTVVRSGGAEPLTTVRPRPAEPPTVVRPASVAPPQALRDPLGQTAPTRIGIERPRLARDDAYVPAHHSSPFEGARSPAAIEWPPESAPAQLGSGVQPREPGSGARSVETGSGTFDGPVSVDLSDIDAQGQAAMALSWDDVPETELPAAARASTMGLAPVATQPMSVRSPGHLPMAALAEDSDPIAGMRPRWPKLVGALFLVVVGGALAYLLLGPGASGVDDVERLGAPGAQPAADEPPKPLRGLAAGTPASTLAASGEAVASSPSSAVVDGSAEEATGETSASSASAPAAALGTSACVAALFPKHTFFHAEPELDFVCTERDVHVGATLMRGALVRARRLPGASEAMRELDELGWYQLVLFVVARSSCCAETPPLATRMGVHGCPLDERLERVGRAAASGDERALRDALEGFAQATQCLARQGAASAFGPMRPLSSSGVALLRKMIARRTTALAR